MENDPLLPTTNIPRRKLHPPSSSSSTLSYLCTLLEEDEVFPPPFSPSAPTPPSLKERIIFGTSPPPPPTFHTPQTLTTASTSTSATDDDPSRFLFDPSAISRFSTDPSVFPVDPSRFPGDPSNLSIFSTDPTRLKGKSNLHRSRTAPAMSSINEVITGNGKDPTFGESKSSAHVVRHAFFYLFLYLCLGVVVYTTTRNQFSSSETHPVVDALYFSIVTMCTIGYGDITPLTALTKIFSVAFVIIGFGFIDILLSGMVSYVLDLQESLLLSAVKARKSGGKHDAGSYLVDVKKGRMRIRMKVTVALGVVFLCVGVGTGVLHFVENLGWLDSFYLSVMSVTTVGYGDHAFKTMPGRLFASIWLLVSTLAVARAFLYLAEARIDKRHRKIAKWALGKDMTVSEFLAADIDNNGFVSKSEFVVYKLKEMGKISEKDIAQVCTQFNKLDTGNCGKIKLIDLIEAHH